jgi:deoxyribonucleoside regulator
VTAVEQPDLPVDIHKPSKRRLNVDNERLELLTEVASLYYEENLPQSEIAIQTGYSRSMVSRMLTEARQQGLVEIRVRRQVGRRLDLERELQEALHLKIVRVAMRGASDYPQMLRRLGTVAARLVEELVCDNMKIGVSWGTAVYETVNALRSSTHSGVHVVQMIGSLGTPDPQIDGPELARRMARTLVGNYTTLPVPLFVDSEATRQSLMNELQIQRVMEQFRSIELALVGVGTIDPEQASLLRAGYLTVSQLEELRQTGAVGDVCAIHFDLSGKLIDVPLTRRVVGVDAATLTSIPLKIGVAGGQSKISPIIGASRAKLINVLVTDELAASNILRDLRGDGSQISG